MHRCAVLRPDSLLDRSFGDCCRTGGFPFLTAGEEAADPLRKMRYMLPRILAGDYLPLPNPVRAHPQRLKPLLAPSFTPGHQASWPEP